MNRFTLGFNIDGYELTGQGLFQHGKINEVSQGIKMTIFLDKNNCALGIIENPNFKLKACQTRA